VGQIWRRGCRETGEGKSTEGHDVSSHSSINTPITCILYPSFFMQWRGRRLHADGSPYLRDGGCAQMSRLMCAHRENGALPPRQE
jgi:hypothetical protein